MAFITTIIVVCTYGLTTYKLLEVLNDQNVLRNPLGSLKDSLIEYGADYVIE